MNEVEFYVFEDKYTAKYASTTHSDGSITINIEPVGELIPFPFSFDLTQSQAICMPVPRHDIDMGIYQYMIDVQMSICKQDELGTTEMCG